MQCCDRVKLIPQLDADNELIWTGHKEGLVHGREADKETESDMGASRFSNDRLENTEIEGGM
jgi:hypothetical protein